MATRSKNNFLHSVVFTLAIILLGYSVLATVSITVFYDYIRNDTYFKSDSFLGELANLSSNLSEYYTTYKDYSSKTANDKVTAEEVKRELDTNENFVNDRIEAIKGDYQFDIDNLEGDKEKQRVLIEQRDNKIEQYKKNNMQTEESIRKQLLDSKNNNYERIKDSINRLSGIKYYLTQRETGEIFTNLKVEGNVEQYIKANSIYWEQFPNQISNSYSSPVDRINSNMLNAKLQGYFMVPIKSESYSSIYYEYSNFQSTRERLIGEGIAGAISFLLSIILFVIISRTKEREKTILNNLAEVYVKIPMELRLMILAGVTALYFALIFSVGYGVLKLPIPAYVLLSLGSSAYMLYIMLHIRGLYHILTKGNYLNVQWKGTILYRSCSWIYDVFVYRNTVLKVVGLLFATFILGICFTSLNSSMAVLYVLAYITLVPIYIMRKISSFSQLVNGSEQIVSGNFDYAIKEAGSGLIKKLAQNFNNIKNGFKASVESQVKSERLKTELITNVSHDLKTPLTSIINYVDLLKNKDLSEEEKEGYIGVLDKKAQRLKVLIEDLFEASKMTSGAVELNREKLDIVAMLKQTLGEFDERINNSDLTFRAKLPSEKIYLNLDGKKTWRVFENLINNALKYSQPNTRVYIELIDSMSSVKVVIKNISNYEMDFDVEEISERFKRGDKSRNTEGSGLGLAIAKSIVELQEGAMNIEIDGDVFKVTVEFRK